MMSKKKLILIAIYVGAFSVTTLFYATAVSAFTTTHLSNAVKAKISVSHPTVSAQTVIINEVMWMGSFGNPKDEWIELRNVTDHDIDIKNWTIEGATNGLGNLIIAGDTNNKRTGKGKNKNKEKDKDSYIIPKGGYFLITRLDGNKTAVKTQPDLVKKNLSFDDSYKKNGPLVLLDKSGNVIDKTPDAVSLRWPAGWNGIFLHLSMERNSQTDNGKFAEDSWSTCIDPKAFGRDYWKFPGVNCGTPGQDNLIRDYPKLFNFDADNAAGMDGAAAFKNNNLAPAPDSSADQGKPADSAPQSGGDAVTTPPVVTPAPETQPADETPAVETPKAADPAPSEVKADPEPKADTAKDDAKTDSDSKATDDKPADSAPAADAGTSTSE